jgi:hypothetical protein
MIVLGLYPVTSQENDLYIETSVIQQQYVFQHPYIVDGEVVSILTGQFENRHYTTIIALHLYASFIVHIKVVTEGSDLGVPHGSLGWFCA